MKIDLRKLYALKKIEINDIITIPEEYYKNTDIIRMSDVNVYGIVSVDYDNNIDLNLKLSGLFVMPCSVSLEEVDINFDTLVEDTILENNINNEFFLDLLDILWENIVLEIPIKVVKEGIKRENLQGEGWEFATSE